MPPAIRIQNLSKLYHIGKRQDAGYRTLRETLTDVATAPLRRIREMSRWKNAHRAETNGQDADDSIWALKDVSFDVQPGEVVGIIGRNGAGKSTLLKVLSRITEPTHGRVELRGRVASLLEVGTGFHQELTGRENIYLNGAILGMTRREIARRMDDIVAFSGVEKFLDTPVKRYSSGMQVRLAFSVASQLESEILIVDEVLAVGDAEFQRKCLGKMDDVARSGRTVLFVSHNMGAVEALCTRGILFESGYFILSHNIDEVIAEYHARIARSQPFGPSPFDQPRRAGLQRILASAALLDDRRLKTHFIPLGGRFHIRIELISGEAIRAPQLGVCIDSTIGQRMLTLHTPLSRESITTVQTRCFAHCVVDPFPLAPGEYCVRVGISKAGKQLDAVDHALSFTVADADAFSEGRGHSRGVCVAPSHWYLETP